MLKIIEGGFYSEAYCKLKEEICELVSAEKKVFLIVPEQQTLIAEREMASILPPSSSLCFEVTNFTRLSNTVGRALGGIAGEYADSGKEALIMWMTLAELAPVLYMTGGHAEINAGLVEKALRAVNEMKGLSVTPEELSALSENETVKKSKRLSDKLCDISRIMTLYNTLLTKRYTSVRDECERLAEKLRAHPGFFADAHFFLTGFTSFTEPQYKVISELIRAGRVTAHLTLPEKRHRGFEFGELSDTERRLIRTANKADAPVELVKANELQEAVDKSLESICSSLWKNRAKIDNNYLQTLGDKVRIFEAVDPYEECDFIAGDIKRRVMEGARWRDFAIISRDATKYAGVLDASLEGANIPHFISKRKSVASYEAIKLIYTAFAVFESSFMREDVISYAKCRLCGISTEACDEFELYTEKWQIEGEGFTNGVFWNMSPDGYSTKKDGAHDAALIRINETREKIITPLMKFCDTLAASTTVREHAAALVAFLLDISLSEKLRKRADELRMYGEQDAAGENERLWDIICSALDSLVEVMGDSETTSRAFLSELKVILSEADVGKIPAFYDEVTVGSADMIRLSEKKHIYIIGVNAGEFPAPAQQGSYFTERDRLTLESVGFSNTQDVEMLYSRELFYFSRAFASAKESVTLLYSQRSTDLTPSAPADVISAFSDMTGGRLKPKKISDIPPIEKIYSPTMAMGVMNIPEVTLALAESGYAHEVSVASGDIEANHTALAKNTVELMYPADMALTQTRIDTYVSCPFSYYLRFNLKLSENGRAEFDARNIGTFIHAILENFFIEVKERGEAIGDINEEKRREMVERAAKKYLLESSAEYNTPSGRTKILLDRLSRSAMPIVDGLCDELKGCAFVPRYFELKIGREDENLPRPATFKDKHGKSIYVYGSIDRVDTFKCGDDVYVRVIDYKTGHKTFSPSDIDEGKNLQMFLYLKALVESDNEKFKKSIGVTGDGSILPAGVIYVKTDMSDVVIAHADEESARAAIRKKQERRGMLLDDDASLAAMNKDFLPIKFKKDGTPDSRSEKYLYSYAGWSELDAKIGEKVCEVAENMRGGDISTTTQKKNPPCDFCNFKPVCRKRFDK